MAGILGRFKDIMSANVNALLDKAEDPEKMIDQYLRNMQNDLGTVKAETAAVMAEETGVKRKTAECEAEIARMEEYAKRALKAGNEADARAFLVKKEALTTKLADLQKSSEAASLNAARMKQMHDKLSADIAELSSRRDEIKAKMKVAKASQKIASMTVESRVSGNISGFEAMEEKANRMMDEADAMIALNAKPVDEIEGLAAKYEQEADTPKVDDELARLKAEMGL